MDRLIAESRVKLEAVNDLAPASLASEPKKDPFRVCIASSFTADSLVPPLSFWMRKLDIAADVCIAPYGQLLQELLNPHSGLCLNATGVNVIVLRIEDWIRDRSAEVSIDQNLAHVRGVARELASAVTALRGRSAAPILVFAAPSSSGLAQDYARHFGDVRRDLLTQLASLPRVHCFTDAELDRLYPVAAREDARADRIAHVPYTDEYFAAIATLIARRITALVKPQYKVIALDCDNTLWKGICGEDGAAQVIVTEAHRRFQEMLVRQHDDGMLLCLCSKNNQDDVEAVFRMHPEMPLRMEHIVCSRINWQPKSENLRGLARELDLSLDSFVFVDDSALECAEVRAGAPGVLTLQFPPTAAEVGHFLDHIWAFDRVGVTDEARRRTAQYRENRQRALAQQEAGDLEKFLASLQLQVDIAPAGQDDLPRVAELVQRTNQFNLNGIRRRAADIESLWRSGGARIQVARVRDRFGHYGLVGALIFGTAGSVLTVNTFVLSCRALGRGVEHRIVSALGRIAQEEHLGSVSLDYRETNRNLPIREFLESALGEFRQPAGAYVIPAACAASLTATGGTGLVAGASQDSAATQSAPLSAPSREWHDTAFRLSRVADLMSEINRTVRRFRSSAHELVEPRTTEERALAPIWSAVLRIESIGVHDDFFELGGDSLLAVRLIARVGEELGVEVPPHHFFEAPTIAELAAKLADGTAFSAPIKRSNYSEPAPLSWAQQRLWFLDQLEGAGVAYHIPYAVRLRGRLDKHALQRALDAIVYRHQSLSTVFHTVNGTQVQEILLAEPFALRTVDLTGEEEPHREARVREHAAEELITAFDLSAGPLVRGRLLKLSDVEHFLLLTMHHIVSDGWSLGLLLRELSIQYEAYASGRSNALPPLTVQYADYAEWQRQWLTGPALQRQLDYWTAHLSDAPALLELPADRPRPAVQSYRGANVDLALGADLTAALKELSRRNSMTLAMTLHAAWTLLLARLSGQSDVVIGIPVANRRRTDLEDLIGFFVNMMPIRVKVDADAPVSHLLQQVKSSMLGAYAHQDIPFEHIVETLKPARSLSYSPIFQAVFVLQNAPREPLTLTGLIAEEQDVPLRTAQFDLTLSLQDTPAGLTGFINYAGDLFDASTVQRWSALFLTILRGLTAPRQARVADIPWLEGAERRQVLEEFNATRAPYPREKAINEVFEEQVARTPDAVAAIYEEVRLSYSQLNAEANRLARFLRARGVAPGNYIPILMPRSLRMLVAQLAVLKCGAVYVPIDPDLPAERRIFILKDCAAVHALFDSVQLSRGATDDVEWIDCAQIDRVGDDLPDNDLRLPARERAPAYVMYTSGSTGVPKGVVVPHHAVNRLAINNGYAEILPTDCIVHYSNTAFDASTFEIWGALLNGARVLILPQKLALDVVAFGEALNREDVTVLWITVGLFNRYTSALADVFSRVRYLITGGDALEPGAVRDVLRNSRPKRLLNAYGPTECTTFSTTFPIEAVEEGATSVPIGRPIANAQIYILDRWLQPVPIGVAGELYIGGDGVAVGYLNRADLTRERFIADPWSTESKARLYKTGDLGKWRADGTIDFLGRNDTQVKIRGFRIELGEIEASLVRHPSVSEAVVVARVDGGEKRLVAYVVLRKSGESLAPEALRGWLQESLPEYMVPTAFVILERLPLTHNGKLDRRALPDPDLKAYASRGYEPPVCEAEQALADIWQSLLKVARVGRRDNFFELGGHSLLVVQMMERLRALGLRAEIHQVFASSTLADLAAALERYATTDRVVPENLIPEDCEEITPQMLPLIELTSRDIQQIVRSVPGGAANVQDIYPLAPLQEGILFHHILSVDRGDAYVVPTLLAVESKERLEELIAALQGAIDRHDVLRTAILWEGVPRPVQVVYRQANVQVEEVRLDRSRAASEQLKEWMSAGRQRLDLTRAPLVRLQIAQDFRGSQWYALLQLHHIVGDNTAQQIVISEVRAHLRGETVFPPSDPYRNHVAQALEYSRTHDAEAFFRGKLETIDEPTASFGLLDVHGDGSDIVGAHADVDSALSGRLRTQARRLGVTPATLFHAAWGLVVAHSSAREDVVFGSVLLGRLQGSAGARRTLGMFINTLPLRLKLHDLSAVSLVEQTHQELVDLLTHEQASLSLAQRCSGITGSAPLFNSLLNFRHAGADLRAELGRVGGVRLLDGADRTNYPITFSVDDRGETFGLVAMTDPRVDPARLIAYLCTSMDALVEALEQTPETPALNLRVLPEAERRQVIEDFNSHQAPRSSLLFHEIFEESAARTPEALATVFNGDSMTYAQMNAKANQLARYLRTRGVGPDKRVALCIERGNEMLLGILGVLKAGGAYVPVDPSYPAARVAYMLEDSEPSVILIQGRLRGMLPASTCDVIAIDEDWNSAIAAADHSPLERHAVELEPHHLAYIIYTSGSTGRPKGVMIEHRHVVNLWHGLERLGPQSQACKRVALNASFNFDASVQQLVRAMAGATLYVLPADVRRDPALLVRFLVENQIECVDTTPSQMKTWLGAGLLEAPHSVRLLLVGGEAVSASLWSALSQSREIQFFNVYGPTECTVDCIAAHVNGDSTAPHIGRPMENRRVYVLDGHGRPCPIGVAGELFIGGDGVGRGYFNRPQLTAERFVRDPFSPQANAFMYRTGDVGRWRADGTIEYLGRNDQQIKFRGYRIELGEIEAQLVRHELVREAAVVLKGDESTGQQLVAYCIPRGDGAPGADLLRAHLKSVLPEHMVPSAFVMLERLPLTPSGKLDARALPAPDLQAFASGEYEAPVGDIEETLASIWQTLLRVERVGRRDNFFELGGHSLLIVQMMERLRRAGLSAEARTIFDHPVLADLAGLLTADASASAVVPPNLIPAGCEAVEPRMLTLVELEAEHIEKIVASVPGGAANIQDIYPLAPLQEGMLFHHLMAERGDTYVVSTVLSVSSRKRLDELIEALRVVVARHDVLRTAIQWEGLQRAVQVVYRQANLPVEEVVHDGEWLEEPQHIDLRRAPLIRLRVAADPHSEQWFAMLQMHHITSDHVMLERVIAEVVALLGGQAQLLSDPVPYREHVAQAVAYSRSHDAEAYFRSKLGDISDPTAPFDLLNVHDEGHAVVEEQESLEPALARRTRSQARKLGISAATLFHAAWGLVMSRTTARADVVFGSVLLGRLQTRAGSQSGLGMFINTLPLRLRLQDASARELVEQTQGELVELLQHEQASLAVAQRSSSIGGSTPLFTALFNYRHSAPSAGADWTQATGIRVVAVKERTNYPITVSVDDEGEGFSLKAQTDPRIRPSRMTGYLRTALESLLKALEHAPDTPAMGLTVLPESERRRVIEDVNATARPYRVGKLVHELFEEQVEAQPHAIAAIHEGESLTYAELNAKANRLARYLRAQGVGPDELVALCVERGLEMVIGLVAILKAGGAYLPLDPNYPPERLHQMLDDAAPRAVLVQQRLREKLPPSGSHVIFLDDVWEGLSRYHADNLGMLALGLEPRHLLYVIYTSGSTGRPKGTAMPHRSMVNLIEWHRETLGLRSGQRVLQFAALSFDVAFQETFSTLCLGGTLVLLDEWVRRDARALLEFLVHQRIERLFMPPLMLQALAECAADADVIPSKLKDVIVAGEQLRIQPAIAALFERMPGSRLHNHYGPTETHVVTALTLASDPKEWPTLPTIGRPIANCQIYILDARLQPAPEGVVGEVYIAGANVARGYLRREVLTSLRFVKDPFSHDSDARMYRTGDLGRWLPDGACEYLGRNDDQVKIRGFRIELGEVELRLAAHSQVREAVVVARESAPGQKSLVAYVSPQDSSAMPGVDSLRAHLKALLPDYMVPSAFVLLESMPVTPSGKLDRRALPAPDADAYGGRQSSAPRGETEHVLAGMWQELLHLGTVGRQENFFELGGHSLLLVQLMERLRRVGLSAPIRTMYENPTLMDMASALGSDAAEFIELPPNRIPPGCERITPDMLPLVDLDQKQIDRLVESVPGGVTNVQDIYPLVPLQEGILFHHMLDEAGGDPYVLPMLLGLSSRDRVDELIRALQFVVDRHDVLRTAVFWNALPEPVQVVLRSAQIPVEECTLAPEKEAGEQIRALMAPELQKMDLHRAPLLKLKVVRGTGKDDSFVLMQLHHLACDHESLEAMFMEVQAYMEGASASLPPAAGYRNHVANVAATARKRDAEDFFRGKLGAVTEPCAPYGLLNVFGDGGRVLSTVEALDPGLSRRVRMQARRAGVSAATLFHAAWGLVVARTTGREDAVFGSVLLGRMQGRAAGGAERVLGMFINTLPLSLDFRNLTAKQLVEHAQHEVVELLTYEQASLAVAQRCSGVGAGMPLFSTLFNYRHSAKDVKSELVSATGVSILETRDRTNYPITVSVDDFGEGFQLTVTTDLRIESKRVAAYLQVAVESLVAALEQAPQTPALSLRILPESERQQLIDTFNSPRQALRDEGLIHEWFEAQVRRTPAATAVTFEGKTLTYEELNARANQLARHLVACGVRPDQPVALCVERSLEMIVGLLGILKAGGAYVPLDPSYPLDRQAYMIENSAPPVILTQERLRSRLSVNGPQVIYLDGDREIIAEQSTANLDAAALDLRSEHLAYIIYTSGSTGKPKGVMIEHHNVTRLFTATEPWFHFNERDVWTLFHSFAFDFSVWEIWGALLYGGRLVVVPHLTTRSPADFYALLCQEGVTVLNQTPSAFTQLVDAQGHAPELQHSLRVVVFGGEALELHTLRPWVDRNGIDRPRLVNMYGITETTVHVTYHVVGLDEILSGRSGVVGRPIPDLQLYLLDAQGQPVPIGITGEIHVGGAGVARGYLGRPDLTQQRFIPDPFSDEVGARLYRAGDIGRWRADGTLEYLGRNDHQVKIRGFRIELGEIEAELCNHPLVKDAVVLAREDLPGEKRLVAYVIARGGEAPAVEAMRLHLRQVLPEHMVPSAIVVLDVLPLTSNGKLDRRALPAPELGAYGSRQFEQPNGPVETALARNWMSLLRIDRVGRHESFFDLGGHSLLATRAVSKIREELDASYSLAAFLAEPTIAAIASRISREGAHAEYAGRIVLRSMPRARHAVCFMPTLLGLGTRYEAIAKHLQVEADYLTCSLPGLLPGEQPLATMEELAVHCIKQLTAQTDYDEWSLIGWSFGGVLAYEAAIQMVRAGLRVRQLVPVDSYLPPKGARRDLANDERLLSQILSHEEEAGAPDATFQRDALVRVFRSCIDAMLTYQPAIYGGAVSEIVAEQEARQWMYQDAAPRRLPLTSVRRVVLRGDHDSIMDASNRAGLLRALDEILATRAR